MSVILGIGHKARNGKDTAANHLVKKYNFTKMAFADALKEKAKLFGWTEEQKNTTAITVIESHQHWGANLQDEEVIKVLDWWRLQPAEKRTTFLQWLGTAYRTHEGEDYWTKKVMDHIEEHPGFYVISDMRYLSEYDAIISKSGYTFDIRRWNFNTAGPLSHDHPIKVYHPFIDIGRPWNHPSEVELDGIPHDFTIEAHSVEHLEIQIDNIMRYLRIEPVIALTSSNPN